MDRARADISSSFLLALLLRAAPLHRHKRVYMLSLKPRRSPMNDNIINKYFMNRNTLNKYIMDENIMNIMYEQDQIKAGGRRQIMYVLQ